MLPMIPPLRLARAACSTAMLSSSTLTRGSPSVPNVRPSVCSATSRSTVASSRPLACATRATWSAAYAGEMCGSSPEPEAVTASGGMSLTATPSRVGDGGLPARVIAAISSGASGP